MISNIQFVFLVDVNITANVLCVMNASNKCVIHIYAV